MSDIILLTICKASVEVRVMKEDSVKKIGYFDEMAPEDEKRLESWWLSFCAMGQDGMVASLKELSKDGSYPRCSMVDTFVRCGIRRCGLAPAKKGRLYHRLMRNLRKRPAA